MFALLGLIPGLLSAATSYFAAQKNAQVEIYKAKTGADTVVATKAIEGQSASDHENTARLGIVAGSNLLTYLVIAFAIPPLAFEWKGVVWDTLLGLGTTEAIHGQLADWMNTIINFVFGGSGALMVGGIAHNYLNRKDK